MNGWLGVAWSCADAPGTGESGQSAGTRCFAGNSCKPLKRGWHPSTPPSARFDRLRRSVSPHSFAACFRRFTASGSPSPCRRYPLSASAPFVVVLPHPVFGTARMRLQAFAIREFGGDFAERLRAFRADFDQARPLEEIIDT